MKVAGAKSYPKGKALKSEILPNRMSRATITGGDPMRRYNNDYGKQPSEQTPRTVDIAGMMRRGY